MSHSLGKRLGIDRPSPFVSAYIEQGNLEVMHPLSVLMVGIGVLGLLSTFPATQFWESMRSIIWAYRLYFSAITILGLVNDYLCRRTSSLSDMPKGTVGRMVFGTVGITLALSAWITIFGYSVMSRYFFLVSPLIVLFGLLVIPPIQAGFFIVATFVASLVAMGQTGILDSVQIVTLLTYCLLIGAVSAARYQARMRAGTMQEAISSAGRHDELTQALNRRSLDEDAAAIAGHPVSVMLSDVDEFKIYNDLYGHATGDAILQCFATTMRQAFPDGRVIRYGGDEFVAVIPTDMEGDGVPAIDERIEAWRQAFHESEIEGTHYDVTCSAGVVSGTPADEEALFGMVRLADMGLYQAKENGRDALVRVPFDLDRLAESAGSTLKVSAGSSDALTGLPDAEFFYDHAQQAAPVMLSRGTPVAFAYFNVGGLKEYNERFGFDAGDELLCKVADIIRDAYPNRLVARIGDDRFLLMAEMGRLTNTLDSVCKKMLDSQVEQVATLHAGIYRYEDPKLLVRVACDRAKVACDSIRGRYDLSFWVYTPELEAESKRRQRVVERFEAALREGQLLVHYQPIVRTVSDHVCDLEALARWDDPDEGMLEASSFIGALEDAGLVRQLDLHVIDTVCEAQATLIRRGFDPLPISINLSAADFADASFIDELEQAMERHGITGRLLRFEVTERAFEESHAEARAALQRLHGLGIQVWMDDFGRSSSALSMLRDCDFDLVKLDIALVRGLSGNDSDHRDRTRVLLMHIVSMAKELGMHTLAEGIESLEDLAFLRNIGCERLQGHIFAPPMPFDEVSRGFAEGSIFPEPSHLRAYYDDMGRVNLVRPVPAGAAYDPTGTADGVPVAIIEHSCLEGDTTPTLHYLMANMPFQYNLEALAETDPTAYDELMALGYGSERGMLWGALDRVLAGSEWVHTQIPGTRRHAYAQRVASSSNGETVAIMLYVPPVRRRSEA